MQTELSQFTAIIGIDWADKKHDVCVQPAASGRRQRYQVQHKADKLDEWARSLYRQYGGPIAVALELSKGPIVSALQKYNFFVIFPIDPTTLANHRKTFTLSSNADGTLAIYGHHRYRLGGQEARCLCPASSIWTAAALSGAAQSRQTR